MKTKLLGITLLAGGMFAFAQTTVISPLTGAEWMDRNLGATQVATSLTDAASYGGLYQWGRKADGHENPLSSKVLDPDGVTTGTEGSNFIYSNWAYSDWLAPGDDTRWQVLDATNNPCPSGFVVPTIQQFLDEGFTSDQNAYDSFLKLPQPRQRSIQDGEIYQAGWADLAYWSRTVSLTDPTRAQALRVDATTAIAADRQRIYGYPVRCIKYNGLGTKDFKTNNFEMYPNPVNSGSKINFRVSEDVKNVKVFVFDTTGKVIHTQNGEARTIELSNATKGIYLVKVVLDNGGTVVKELIVN